MVALASKFVGYGMYTPAEAAMYARVKPQLMSRWVHGSASGAAVVQARVESSDGDRTVAFVDMIQAMAIRAVREQSRGRVTLQTIRQAVDTAAQLGLRYPFARRHTIYRWQDRIALRVDGIDLVEASGRHRGHMLLKIVELHLEDIGYDDNGLANDYHLGQGPVRIRFRPDFQFGQPVVEPSGHTAWTLWEAVQSMGDVTAVAEAYRVDEEEVRVAYRYIDSIRPATAA